MTIKDLALQFAQISSSDINSLLVDFDEFIDYVYLEKGISKRITFRDSAKEIDKLEIDNDRLEWNNDYLSDEIERLKKLIRELENKND